MLLYTNSCHLKRLWQYIMILPSSFVFNGRTQFLHNGTDPPVSVPEGLSPVIWIPACLQVFQYDAVRSVRLCCRGRSLLLSSGAACRVHRLRSRLRAG